jgi:transposase
MIKMLEKQKIIHMYIAGGKSLREISRELGVSRQAVTKIVREYESALLSDNPEEAVDAVLTTRPQYHSGPRRCPVVTQEVRRIVSECLKENERRRFGGMRKQRMSVHDIRRKLEREGFKVSYSSVSRCIKKLRQEPERRRMEAYIKQWYEPGQECEFDWGEVCLVIGGRQRKLYMAVFTLCHSNGRWAYLFRRQDTLAFMESHRNFFGDISGVPRTMVYDNMRVAVKGFVGGKEPTPALLRMADFYGFSYRFCNARAGWEKGHVEKSVGYVRSRAFDLDTSFGDFTAAQSHLADVCAGLNAEESSPSTAGKAEALADDLGTLLPSPGKMGCFEMRECTVDKLSTVCINGSHYSVPDRLVGLQVSVRLYSMSIAVYHGGEKVAEHERSWEKGRWMLDIGHYLDTLERKPGAIGGSCALRQMPKEMRELYEKHFRDCGREFVGLLKFSSQNGFGHDDILSACRELRRRGVRRLSADQVRVMMQTGVAPEESLPEIPDLQRDIIESGSDAILAGLTGAMAAGCAAERRGAL